MDLNKFKAENFWLRAGLTLMILIWLTSISIINRGVIDDRKKLTDSVSYYRHQYNSLLNLNDSLRQQISFDNDQIGKRDMIIEDAKMASPRMINELLKNTEGLTYEK